MRGAEEIGLRGIFGGDDEFAGLQRDAVTAFELFQNLRRLLFAVGDDFGKNFEKRFAHRGKIINELRA